MLNIVLLASQERLLRLFKNSEVLNAGTVRVAKCLEEALSAISSRERNLLFIQERIGEMSGELLAYRLAAQLKGKKSQIVLFGKPDAIPATGRKPFHAVLDTRLSDQELTAAVMEMLAAPMARSGRKKTLQKKKSTSQTQEKKSTETFSPVFAEKVDDVVAISGKSSPARDDAGSRQTSMAGQSAKASFQDNLDRAMGGADEAPVVPRRSIPLVPPEPSTGPIRVMWGKPTLQSRIRERMPRPRVLVFLALVIAGGTALVLFLLLHERQTAGPGAVPTASPSTSSAEGKGANRPFLDMPGGLPSFLSRMTEDPGYGKANPGWERYRDTSTEYRVFREKATIRAFQVIDRSGQGISPGLLGGVLLETAGSSRYVIETTEQKGSFSIEKGRVENGDGIIIYRKEPEGSVKGFVLELK